MSILHDDISTCDKAYAHWVAHRHELEPLIRQWHRDAKGAEPSEFDINHALWRGANEWARWRTWENALQDTWPKVTSSGEPKPVSGIHPSNIGRVIKIADNVLNRGYSYWAQTRITTDGLALSIVGVEGRGVCVVQTELNTEHSHAAASTIRVMTPGTGEGIYFDARGRVCYPQGPQFIAGSVAVFDISTDPRFVGCDLWQAHSSEDGKVHSATVRQIVPEGAYPKLGTVVWINGKLEWFAKVGDLDESHIDASGRWLVIEESDDNRIIDLQTGTERLVEDEAGALSHIDCGNGFMVGENNHAGACFLIDLATGQHTALFDTWNTGHVGVRGQHILNSTSERVRLLDSIGNQIVSIAHGMTIPPGTPEWQLYDYQVMANLSPCGRVATFASNKDGTMDLYLWVIG